MNPKLTSTTTKKHLLTKQKRGWERGGGLHREGRDGDGEGLGDGEGGRRGRARDQEGGGPGRRARSRAAAVRSRAATVWSRAAAVRLRAAEGSGSEVESGRATTAMEQLGERGE